MIHGHDTLAQGRSTNSPYIDPAHRFPVPLLSSSLTHLLDPDVVEVDSLEYLDVLSADLSCDGSRAGAVSFFEVR